MMEHGEREVEEAEESKLLGKSLLRLSKPDETITLVLVLLTTKTKILIDNYGPVV